jgi:hypothetical protein
VIVGSARRLSLISLVAVAAGCGSSSPGSAVAVVPWVNSPIPLYVAPPAKLRRYATSAPVCRASQLEVRQGREGVGLGNRLEELVFTNTGSGRCMLRGYPSISGVTQEGGRQRLPARHGGTYFGTLVPANLPPRGHVLLDFGTSNGICGNDQSPRATVFRQLEFRLPSGGLVRAGPHVRISEVCAIDMTTFGLPADFELSRPKLGTVGSLQVRLRLPAEVRPGGLMQYVVTLVNTSDVDVRLQPCPGYTQDVTNAVGASLRRSYRLNCDSVRNVAAHSRVRYAMRLAVPRGPQNGGYAKISWTLNTPYGPSAGGAVRVTS